MKTHCKYKTRLNRIWDCMKSRCYNKKLEHYKYYGGRGVSICNEWKGDFVSFYDWSMKNGYKEGLTIDRINNDGNYEPSNCRWATVREQNCNQRKRKDNKTGYTGIFFHKDKNRYFAYISEGKGQKYLGGSVFKKNALCIRNKYIIENELINKLQEWNDE